MSSTSPRPVPPSPDAPNPVRGESYLLYVWGFIGIIALVVGGSVAFDRKQAKVEEREVTEHVPVQMTKVILMEVETEDGKKVKAWVPTDEYETRPVTAVEKVTREPTPDQKLRLNIILVFSIVIGVFLVVLISVYAYRTFRGSKVPKSVEDWLKYLVSGIFGAVLGFLSAPTGDAQLKTEPVKPNVAISSPAKK